MQEQIANLCTVDKKTPQKKPDWIKVKAPISEGYYAAKNLMVKHKLNTVCEEAACPNIAECWQKSHVTVMILGRVCTRACHFCNIATGKPNLLDPDEPKRLADSLAETGMKHVVITSVTRDDLSDGGANQFARCIAEIRKTSPNITIEVLTPDFLRKDGAIETVVAARPDVYNHNMETVPSLYKQIRRGAKYPHSLYLLNRVKELDPNMFTKSGLMLGLGEERHEVIDLMNELRAVQVDFLTIGQYLQPTPKHAEVKRFVPPEEFSELRGIAFAKGFLMVSSSPMTRTSYHADEDFLKLKLAREQRII